MRADYKDDGKANKFYTHNQYLLKADPEDVLSYGGGYYFEVYDIEKLIGILAFSNWQKRCLESVLNYNLASLVDFNRFMANVVKKDTE